MPRASVKAAILASTGLPIIFGASLALWHNVQNLDMTFQDYVGTPAVVGSSVALQLDSAQGERRTSLGPELVTNGGFDADTDWTKDNSATVSGGLGHTVGLNSRLRQDVLTVNRLYKVAVTVSNYTSGTPAVQLGGTSLTVPSANGTYTLYGYCSGYITLGLRDGSCDWDNISVREVITVTEQARGSELKANGLVGLVGTATAATYDTVTGAGSVTRAADASNQSYLRWSSMGDRVYVIDLEVLTGTSVNVRSGGEGSTTIATLTAGQRRTVYVMPSSGNITLTSGANSTTATFTVHSVKECLGTPRYQTTSAQRPILGRHPKGGRRNLCVYTETHSGAQLGTAGGTSPPTITGTTYGGVSVEAITFPAVAAGFGNSNRGGGGSQAGSWTSVSGTTYTASAYIALSRPLTGSEAITVYQTGAIAGPTTATLNSSTTNPTTLQRYSGSASVGASGGMGTYAFVSGTLLSPVTVYITEFQVETGSVATNYQAVTTTYDCTETGVPDCYFLQADGSDDGMVTPAIDLSATDKIAVFAGVRKLSDAATAMLVESSAIATSNNGSFYITAPEGGGTNKFAGLSRGTAGSSYGPTSATYNAPYTGVVTLLGNISGDSLSLRINGAQAISGSGDQGTGNYGNYALYYFRRGGSSLPFNGLEYGNFIVDAYPTDAQIAAGETYQNNYIGAY